jgi:hypothetical protein
MLKMLISVKGFKKQDIRFTISPEAISFTSRERAQRKPV